MAFQRLITVFAVFAVTTAALLGWVFYSDTAFWSSGAVKLEIDNTATRTGGGVTGMQPVSKRVAIIGAGSGGTSAAHYLRWFTRATPYRLNITLFEKSNYIGGRSTTVDVYSDPSEPVELGASIFVAVNYNLVNAAKEFGLSVSSASSARPQESDNSLGVFDGTKFVFLQPATSSKWEEWMSLVRILYKYGPVAPIRARRLTEATVGKFLKMYSEPIFPFSSLSSAAEEVGLLEATANTGEQFLTKNGVEGKFTTDLMQASTRVNYGQNLGLIHGLETMVCMATDGAVSVEGGNWQIFQGMAKASGAEIRLETKVLGLRREKESQTWFVRSKRGEEEREEEFDDVILASPWQFTGLDVEPKLARTPDKIPYVTLHVTLFTSKRKLSPEYFGLAPGGSVPETVLTTLNETEQSDPNERWSRGELEWAVGSIGFFSISSLRRIIRTEKTSDGEEKGRVEYLYKVFSPLEFGDDKLRAILGAGEEEEDVTGWVYRHVWKSYPYLYPRVTFEDPLLDRNLWYTSGIESFISTMETSSLMGMNVAKLVVNSWEKEKGEQKKDDHKEKIKSKL